MKLHTTLISSGKVLKLICLVVIGSHAFLSAYTQSDTVDPALEAKKAQKANIEIRSVVTHIEAAEVRSVSPSSGFYPSLQPEVYWHDADWNIDLLPFSPSDHTYSLSISYKSEKTQIVRLDNYAQIDSISRAPNDKAIIVGDYNGMTQMFSVVDLKLGKEIDGGFIYDPSISPDRRFILYENWYPPHSDGFNEKSFTVYDTMKTHEENTCGYWDNTPRHIGRSDEGVQVYPLLAVCTDGEDENDNNKSVSGFIWSADSRKVVFADVRDGYISLILVTMPIGITDRPQTTIYRLVGAENVCTGAANCDYNNVRSITWDGQSVDAVLIQKNPGGAPIERDMSIPVSKFVPISK
jgi:hypothetical protein